MEHYKVTMTQIFIITKTSNLTIPFEGGTTTELTLTILNSKIFHCT